MEPVPWAHVSGSERVVRVAVGFHRVCSTTASFPLCTVCVFAEWFLGPSDPPLPSSVLDHSPPSLRYVCDECGRRQSFVRASPRSTKYTTKYDTRERACGEVNHLHRMLLMDPGLTLNANKSFLLLSICSGLFSFQVMLSRRGQSSLESGASKFRLVVATIRQGSLKRPPLSVGG